MMGTKERIFAPLTHISLEELVPQNHFYRHLEQKLDLSFVRSFVQEIYAHLGRPSIDPIVFFKLQLVMSLRAFDPSANSCSKRPTVSAFTGILAMISTSCIVNLFVGTQIIAEV